MSYGEYRPPRGEPVVQLHYGENAPRQYNISTKEWQTPSDYLYKEGSSGPPSRSPIYLSNIFDVGIFKDTLAPSLALHSGLAVAAWGLGRYYDRVEAKDWLWPSSQVINAWWSAIGRRVLVEGTPLSLVLNTISWPERLLLAGVTAWGSRMFYRIASKSVKRGKDNPAYDVAKKEEGFWNKALFSTFLPEAAIQTVIALPFTAVWRHQGGVMSGYHPVLQSVSVGMFTAGFALELLADYQLEVHQRSGATNLQKEGVWSLVRHPNYLGDVLVHASFPLLLFSSDMLAPIELLGPIANYLYLRYIGGEGHSEASQSGASDAQDPVKKQEIEGWKREKNSFWPGVGELQNQWTWFIVGAGFAGVALERALRHVLH